MHEGQGSENQAPGQPGEWSPLPDGPDHPAGPDQAGGLHQPGPAAHEDSPGTSWVPSPGASTGQVPARAPDHYQGSPPPIWQGPSGQQAAPAPAEGQTWVMPAGGQGHGGQGQWLPPPAGGPAGQVPWNPSPPGAPGPWAPPPGSGPGGWSTPPPGGYGQPGYGQPGYGQPGGPPPRRGSRALLYLLVAVLAAAVGAVSVLALQSGASNQSSLSPQDIPSPASNPGNSGTNTSTINMQAVAAKVEPGVVDITSTLRYTGQVFEGTGIVLSSSGLVLTNNHVVAGSTRLTATLVASGHRYLAQVVGTDATDDVALLRLVGAAGLTPVHVGNSAKVTLGTPVVAMGNAGGTGGAPTVTSGTITALHRTITASDSGSNSSEVLHNMLQTNAPIAEGDSGGPLANAAGQVIGMDTAANTQALGGPGTSQGFAIPINRALAIARQMAAGQGSSSIRIGQPAFMGVAVASTASNAASSAESPQQQLRQLQQTASQFGGGVDSSRSCLANDAGNPVPGQIAPASSGTLIAGVFCGAPAHVAGLAGGDVILAVNGQAVAAPATLTQVLSHYHPGDRISVSWMDTSGQRHTTSLTLTAGPAK